MSTYRKTFAGIDPEDYENCPDFLARYLHYLSVFESRKSSYVQDTLLCLREFFQFVHYQTSHDGALPPDRAALKTVAVSMFPIADAAAVTSTQAESYLHFAEIVLKNARGTIRKKTIYLRSFYAYLLGNCAELGIQLTGGNPITNIKSPATSPVPAAILTHKEIQQLIRCVPPGVTQDRDKAILLLLATSTLSIAELVGLDRSDIAFREGQYAPLAAVITILRNGRHCQIPLSNACAKCLKAYIEDTDPLLPQYHNALFLSSEQAVRINERSVQKRIRIAAAHAGLSKPVTAHVLRDTAIAHYLKNLPQNRPQFVEEDLLMDALAFKTNSAFRRVAAQELLTTAAAKSPLNNLEV